METSAKASADATPSVAALPPDAIEVGSILDAWGIKGWIKVQPYAADPQALFSSRRWYLTPGVSGAVERPGRAAEEHPSRLLKIIAAKQQGDWVIAQAQDIVDRNAAEALRGARVFISRGSFPSADADEYYWVDLIGLDVVNRDGVGLGKVVGLLDTGPHSVLRVTPASAVSASAATAAVAEEILIPFVAAYVDAVHLPERRIEVDWGLDY